MKKQITFPAITLLCLLFGSNSLLISCNNNKSKPETETTETENPDITATKRSIKNISALYYNYVFTSNNPVKPEKIQKNIPNFKKDRKGILDASITDTDKLERIKPLLESMRASGNQTPLDARIVLTINYSDKSKDILCIGGPYSSQLYLNGVEQQTNNKLLFILKNYIGFYPWMIGDDMFGMVEMRDNSFPKEPFFSSSYYKQYQEALASR